jgi:peptide-methionine (R)-S-oxide reductase
MNRRSLIALIAATPFGVRAAFAADGNSFEIMLTDEEWRARLSPLAYDVLRHEATERAFSSPLDKEYGAGVYNCAGCDLPLFDAAAKYDSGTGWPSFHTPITNAVRTKRDLSIFGIRTEVHCRRCGGHLGHVFEDGPAPTGLRYCMNGVSLKFLAKA